MADEQWRPIAGYEGAYEISDLGRVRSVGRYVAAGPHGGRRWIDGGVRAEVVGGHGYPQATLRRRTHFIHILVARAFLGEPPAGYEVCHNNGDPLDSRLENLRYDTRSENMRDIVRHGRHQAALRTHCPQHHPYDEANTLYRKTGGRRCRQCVNAQYRRRKEMAA